MLARQIRFDLRHHPHFFQQASYLNGKFSRAWFIKAPEFKASVVVGKKVSVLATDRNALKRKFHAALQTYLQSGKEIPQAHVVFTAFPKIKYASPEEIVGEVVSALQNLVAKNK